MPNRYILNVRFFGSARSSRFRIVVDDLMVWTKWSVIGPGRTASAAEILPVSIWVSAQNSTVPEVHDYDDDYCDDKDIECYFEFFFLRSLERSNVSAEWPLFKFLDFIF